MIPTDAIGGVEVAAQRSERSFGESMDFELFIIKKKNQAILHTIRLLIKKILAILRQKNITIVSSLWPSHFICLFLKLLNPKIRWVPFFHASTYFGVLDRVISLVTISVSKQALVDSEVTKNFIQGWSPKMKLYTVPFIFEEDLSTGSLSNSGRQIDYLWVGRDDSNKNIASFLDFCEFCLSTNSQLKFCIVCSSAFSDESLRRLSSNPLIKVVQCKGWEETQRILKLSRYLVCTSDKEGFAMVAFEALANGCLPCGNQVGELHKIISEEINLPLRLGPATYDLFLEYTNQLSSNEQNRIQKVLDCIDLVKMRYPYDYKNSFSKHLSAMDRLHSR